jgi:hypothetical protein
MKTLIFTLLFSGAAIAAGVAPTVTPGAFTVDGATVTQHLAIKNNGNADAAVRAECGFLSGQTVVGTGSAIAGVRAGEVAYLSVTTSAKGANSADRADCRAWCMMSDCNHPPIDSSNAKPPTHPAYDPAGMARILRGERR